MAVRHETKAEILLSICDLVAGARTDDVCTVDSGPFAMIGHRVQTINRILLA